ncbi:MAG: hypothetical protein ABSD57_03780 [Verrucomicrobiota bacterium]
MAVATVVTELLVYWQFHGRVTAPSRPGEAKGGASHPNGAVEQSQGGEIQSTNRIFLARPDQVLATVNGTPITLGDLMLLQSTNSEAEQKIDSVTYNYFLQRAINRELVLQAAKAQGVTLNQAQEDQLTKLRAEREQPEPGLVSKLTVNAAEIEFELRDAQAFMLQTSLMAQAGATPNVTPDQVEQYYQAHIAEFGELPADPQARQQAWQTIDIQIRGQLAAGMRAEYQQQLDAYMAQLKARANIVVTPLMESPIGVQTGS